MIIRCYSIYDRKALQYHPPFHAAADGAAARMVADLVADPNTTIGRHPGDYVLYYVGDYDDQTGAMIPAKVLVHVVDAMSFVAVEPQLPLERPPAADSKAATNGEAR